MHHLVIGGAGFIGINMAEHQLKKGHQVTVFDNLSRKGTPENLAWLQGEHPGVRFVEGDVRYDSEKLEEAIRGADVVYFFAGQVAVTTSVENPREDFEINALGGFNVLEAARKVGSKAVLFYSSTNKVYGGMEEVKIADRGDHYDYEDFPEGIPESQQLDFHSPYGCSKGATDQYWRDYARIYGLRTVVFRQSCIYGQRQFGIEDQGWVAWFSIAALADKMISIFGDGKQVRDVLHIDDLLGAYDMAYENAGKTAGKIYNVGGGRSSTMSLLQLLEMLEKLLGRKVRHKFADWRPGDQPVYISDIRQAKADFGWEPRIFQEEGVGMLFGWLKEHQDLFRKLGVV